MRTALSGNKRKPGIEMESQKLDAHLDKVLRAAGSALRHYSFPKSRDDMRAALQAALEEADADEREACAKVCEAQTETGAHKRCAAAIRARNQPTKGEGQK